MNANRDSIVAKVFPLVCIGGSAGSLDVDIRLLQNLPPDLGVAIVIVNHIRNNKSQLQNILARYTEMPVEVITERRYIQPNSVFIIPGNCDLHILNGKFWILPKSKIFGWPDVITIFLRSITRNWNGKIIAVIVSGLAADGAAALHGIREMGGITIAQKPDTAEQPEMPESAIASGFVDFVLSPEDIAKEIVHIVQSINAET